MSSCLFISKILLESNTILIDRNPDYSVEREQKINCWHESKKITTQDSQVRKSKKR